MKKINREKFILASLQVFIAVTFIVLFTLFNAGEI
jgi:hypothetical protein